MRAYRASSSSVSEGVRASSANAKSAGSTAEMAAKAQAIKALQNNQLPQLEERATAAGLPAQGQKQ